MTTTNEVAATASGRTDSYAGSREVHRLEVAMLAAGLAAFGLLYVTQAVLPSVGTAFGVSATVASLTVSFATGGLALAILPMSSLAESFGRARMMRIGMVAALLLAVGCATSTHFWELLTCRALMGIALGAVVAVGMGHLGDEIHPSKVSGAMGIYVAGNTIGGVVGRLVPGIALDFGSWRFAVLMFTAFASVAILTFSLLLPAPRRFTPVPARGGHHLRAARELLADSGIRKLCGIAFLLMGGFVACYNFLTFRLTSAPIDLSGSAASRLFLAYLAGTVSSTAAGYCAGRFGRRRVLCSGIALMLGGLALTLPDHLGSITVGLVIFTAGFFAAHSTASGWISARASRSRAQASALYLMAYYLGSSTLGAAVGLAFLVGGWSATVIAIAVLAVAAFGLARSLDPGR
ncbi:MFS transporter [Nakamurella panacisegetis]|uniref:MFS transporter n=1 Tax=Nakamurella panacisegetis TaxID=1090615 RepID=UPI0012FD8A8A|nr:MFS transporter [Nakamurella panacisegetis]